MKAYYKLGMTNFKVLKGTNTDDESNTNKRNSKGVSAGITKLMEVDIGLIQKPWGYGKKIWT